MKKNMIALAVTAAFALPVFAQTSITLYGVIDEGINYTSNAGDKSAYQLESGYAQGSRWGLKGSEDLGSGLKAIFDLENGFDASTGAFGQGGRMFGRQAFVGLTAANYGTVTLGRQYDSVVDYLAQATANGNWGGYLLSHPYDNDNTDNSFRVNNTIKYASPDFAGLQFGGTYSFSNDTNFANNRQYSLGGQYTSGGLLVTGAYLQADNPGLTTSGSIATDDANFISERLRIFGGGVNYTVDTLAHFRREEPDGELFFLMGADMLHDLPHWRQPAKVCEWATLVVVCRPPVAELDFESLTRIASVEQIDRIRRHQVEMPQVDISSTEIRRRVAEGLSIRYQTPRAVEKYIETHGLYRP